MANLAAQTASQGLTGPQATQQAMFGGTGMLGQLGFGGSHQFVIQQIQQQQAAAQAASQAQTAASSAYNQDSNNASASGFSSQPAIFPSAELATGNAPNNTITAGMAVGNAPIATANNFNPQTEFAASKMFGNGTQFVPPKKLINL